VDSSLREYIVKIIDATRQDAGLILGASPRGSLALYKASQAYAAMNGRDYVIPEDVKNLAVEVLKHRIILRSETKLKNLKPENIIERVLSNIPVPMEAAAKPAAGR
jgi:MoxR-like ATPase